MVCNAAGFRDADLHPRSGRNTHVDWSSDYTHPIRAGGRLLAVVSRPLLRSSFAAILAGCAGALAGRSQG